MGGNDGGRNEDVGDVGRRIVYAMEVAVTESQMFFVAPLIMLGALWLSPVLDPVRSAVL